MTIFEFWTVGLMTLYQTESANHKKALQMNQS